MTKPITMGSLFSGFGGFEVAAQWHGVQVLWQSEIETWAVELLKHRFPEAEQLGDVCNINGAEIEPVDIITFGSPCQDMSIAGKRSGLDGERSGLFREAVRIIREMRESTNGEYPIAWDNPKDDLLDKFKYVQSELNLPIRKLKAYVLTNFNTTFDEDLYRVYALRDIGIDPYEKDTAPQQIRYLQRWCNNKIIFRSEPDFEKYDPRR